MIMESLELSIDRWGASEKRRVASGHANSPAMSKFKS